MVAHCRVAVTPKGVRTGSFLELSFYLLGQDGDSWQGEVTRMICYVSLMGHKSLLGRDKW